MIDYQGVVNYYHNLAKYDWCARANRYCDFTEVEKFRLDYDQVNRLAQYRMSKLSSHLNIKIAIYSASDLGFAFGRMYQSLMDAQPVEVLVSRDTDVIAGWLEAPIDLLQQWAAYS